MIYYSREECWDGRVRFLLELCAIGVGISLKFGFLVGEWAGGGLCDLIGFVSVASGFVDRFM